MEQIKYIKPEELTETLTPEMIHVLGQMANEFPVSDEWRAIYKLLTDEQLTLVLNEVSRIQREIHQRELATMTEEEKQKEKEWWDNRAKNPNPDEFLGNMGQPETLEQYKNRYGRYPLGYDENGNKIDNA
jgi:hypothetical protein